jgi:hypothetical protein
MGKSVLTDVVQNVACIGEVDELEDLDSWDNGVHKLACGWTQDCDVSMNGGKHGRLYVTVLAKDMKTVLLVNQDPYANGGGVDLAVFSSDRSAVEEFLKDIGMEDCDILDEDSVSQTL